MMTGQNQKAMVAVGMSGGVDSSVTAALLLEQGYRVIGIMMRLWNGNPDQNAALQKRESQEKRAREIAHKLDIPFEIIDLEKEFRTKVVGYYLSSLKGGQTPNPCFVCNREIKWGTLLQAALDRGADRLATGHYARVIRRFDGSSALLKGVDAKKDQSYVLAGLSQTQLSHILLPLGEMTKEEIRHIAHRLGFGFQAEEESQDLCFLGGVSQELFLETYATNSNRAGVIRMVDGQVVGEHNGLSNYTIGQRKGLGSGFSEAVYVLEKDVLNNEIIIGTKALLGSHSMTIGNVSWISGREPFLPTRFNFKIRYKSGLLPGKLIKLNNSEYQVFFEKRVRDATPGQYAVFYHGDEVMGSGVIQRVIREGS